jgi:hypothetical protein
MKKKKPQKKPSINSGGGSWHSKRKSPKPELPCQVCFLRNLVAGAGFASLFLVAEPGYLQQQDEIMRCPILKFDK